MNLPKIRVPQKITRTIGKLALKTRKIKPDVCIIGGVILATGSVVVAVVDTWKNKETLESDISEIKQLKAYNPGNDPEAIEVSDKNTKWMLRQANKKLYSDILKTYWKTAVLTSGSIVLIFTGRKMMRKQIVELSAMYASLLESYRRYRQNVVAELGAEKDQEFAYGIKTIEVVDSETGEVSKKVIPTETGMAGASTYARWLNEGIWDSKEQCYLWQNILYTGNKLELQARLRLIQNELNDMLRMKGWLTLNQAYRKLGFPQTREGQHVGWVRGGILNGHKGDDFVDLAVFPNEKYGDKYQLPVNKLFLDPASNQHAPLLDFNVIPLDDIWNNIYEYDNDSMVAFAGRNPGGYDGDLEYLDRWFQGNN